MRQRRWCTLIRCRSSGDAQQPPPLTKASAGGKLLRCSLRWTALCYPTNASSEFTPKREPSAISTAFCSLNPKCEHTRNVSAKDVKTRTANHDLLPLVLLGSKISVQSLLFGPTVEFTEMYRYSPCSKQKKRGDPMFIELMPLIESRPLTITVACLDAGQIRVNIVPQALAKDSKANEKIGYANRDKIAPVPEAAIHALTPPLSLTGKPDEIDAELVEQLETFIGSHQALRRSIDVANEQIADAVRAIEERDKARLRSKTAPTKPDDKSSRSSPTDRSFTPSWDGPLSYPIATASFCACGLWPARPSCRYTEDRSSL